ncbi:hypothetical protein GCM10009634_26810 [Saccharothrix xinjiangensis]
MKVFGWSADQAGCGWYRMRMPLDELARRGHETHVAEEMPREWLDTCQVLIAQRICKPAASRTWQRIAQHPARPLMVVELDDDLWSVPPSSRVAYEWFSKPEVQENLRQNIRVADLVTVSTEPLADVVREFNPNVHVVPNAVPAGMLAMRPSERLDDRVVIGWGGSSTHVMDFADIGPKIVEYIAGRPDVLWHTVSGPRQLMMQHMRWLRRLPSEQWRALDWCEDIWDYYCAIGTFDISTAPLVPHVFNRSKSPIKALEAAARGVPMVASDVGPYSEFVRHGETGLLVKHAHEWPRALRTLVLDPGMREEMGAAARLQAREHTIERRGDEWEKVLLSQLSIRGGSVTATAPPPQTGGQETGEQQQDVQEHRCAVPELEAGQAWTCPEPGCGRQYGEQARIAPQYDPETHDVIDVAELLRDLAAAFVEGGHAFTPGVPPRETQAALYRIGGQVQRAAAAFGHLRIAMPRRG